MKEMAKEAAAAKLQEWYRAVKGVVTETMAVKEAVTESVTANGVVNPTMVACEQELDKVAVTVTSAAKQVMNQTVVAHKQDPDKAAETMEAACEGHSEEGRCREAEGVSTDDDATDGMFDDSASECDIEVTGEEGHECAPAKTKWHRAPLPDSPILNPAILILKT